MKSASPKRIARHALAAAAAVALLAFGAAPAAFAQVLYKWVDATGKIQYSDVPPKNFKGEVTRIVPDEQPAVPAPVPRAAPPSPEAGDRPAADLATQRRTLRNQLFDRLSQARARLDAAKLALADAPGPGPEERQIVQQRLQGGGGGMHGLSSGRSNCREVVKDGKKSTFCPALLATAPYYERIEALEQAVRAAEEELAAAEQAFRRGMD
jgi:hypothetical protein